MSDPRFDEFFKLLTHRAIEGGFSNRDTDAGGKTNYGITLKTYKSAIVSLKLPDVPIENMKLNTAKIIYFELFYKPCQYLEDKESHYNFFDMHVNSGYKAYLQLKKQVDGLIDPVEMRLTIYKFRTDFFTKIAERNKKTGAPNLRGWLLRLKRIQQYFKEGKITQ